MLAVKLYGKMPKDNENVVLGISPKIPAEVIFGVEEALSKDYILMTDEEYHAYDASLVEEYAEWRIIQESQPQK